MKKIFYILTLSLAMISNVYAKETLRVGYLPILDHLPLVIAHANDNATNKHVDVVPKKLTSWAKMVGAVKNGAIDAAFILAPLAMDMYNKKDNIQTILLAHRDGSAITVKVGSGIKSAADLKGKVIAIPDKKSTHNALLNQYLSSASLTFADVKTPVIAPPYMERAMKKGAIDAFIVAEPFGAKAQTHGVGEILVMTSDIQKNHLDCIVIVKKQFLAQNPEGIQEWVDSLIRAGKFIDADKVNNNSTQVATIASAKKYLGHQSQAIVNGLQMPSDRISFSDLNPAISGFKSLVEISQQAKILDNITLSNFVNESFYKQSSEK